MLAGLENNLLKMDQNPVISTIHSEDNSSSFLVKKGITDRQINQLIQYALDDPELEKFTSDPKRFNSRESFDEFSKHIMTYYTLTDEADNLLGVIWFDDFPLEEGSEYGISYAIRVYGRARGKGAAVPFSRAAFDDFKKSPEYLGHLNRKIWLAVSPENIPAKKVYQKLGFKDLKMNDQGNKLLMIL